MTRGSSSSSSSIEPEHRGEKEREREREEVIHCTSYRIASYTISTSVPRRHDHDDDHERAKALLSPREPTNGPIETHTETTLYDRCARAGSSMDIATRFQPRPRGTSYLDQPGAGLSEDTSTEGENYHHHHRVADAPATARTEHELVDPLARRNPKFQRTPSGDDSHKDASAFRKPTIPASASRPQTEQPSGLSHRRRSTLRENVRVPSGPREYPGSPGKRYAIMLRVGAIAVEKALMLA